MIKDSFGNFSHKKIISFVLIIVAIVMAFMKYDIEMVIVFLGAGLINIGMTVFQGVKNMNIKGDDNPPPGDEEKPPK